MARFPYRSCVYGRCTECRNDDDCAHGPCLPPGMCFGMDPHPQALYGTWLIGWAGGMDHFSYFRFEPDGTFRRGTYEPQGAWADDVPHLPCAPEHHPWPSPLTGTWEPEATASGLLVVRVSLNLDCHTGAGWTGRYGFTLTQNAEGRIRAQVLAIDEPLGWDTAWKMPSDICTPDFSECQAPRDLWWD